MTVSFTGNDLIILLIIGYVVITFAVTPSFPLSDKATTIPTFIFPKSGSLYSALPTIS